MNIEATARAGESDPDLRFRQPDNDRIWSVGWTTDQRMRDRPDPENYSLFEAEAVEPSPPDPKTSFASVKALATHPAARLVLLGICLAVALPYILASAPEAPAPSAAKLADGGAIGPANAAAFAPKPMDDDALQVVQSSFDPVFVERLEAKQAANPLDIATSGSGGPPGVTTEMLRIIAQMTPEQIDALTFLLLSQQDPTAADAAGGAIADAPVDAPWVGDWSGVEGQEEPGDLAAVEAVQNELLRGWHVYEANVDEAVIRSAADPLSAISVSPGTVVGNIGTVTEIRLEAGLAKVVLSSGDVIVSDATSSISFAPPAPPPVPQRSGPPFEAWGLDAPEAGILPVSAQSATDGDTSIASDATTSFDTDLDALSDISAEVAGDLASAAETVAVDQTTQSTAQSDAALAGRYVQVASFKSIKNAEIARNMLTAGGVGGDIDQSTWRGSSYHRVLAGPFEPADIRAALTKVTGLGFKDAFIIR